MADATAITGIIVSGVVGPSLAALWTRSLARSQYRRDRESADLKELRILLDQGLDQIDVLIKHFEQFSKAWGTAEEEPSARSVAELSAAYDPLDDDLMGMLVLQSRFDARLGPAHGLSEGFRQLSDQAWEFARAPGGFARHFDAFDAEQRHAVMELSRAEQAVFLGRRTDWLGESLPLAGLRLPEAPPEPEAGRRATA